MIEPVLNNVLGHAFAHQMYTHPERASWNASPPIWRTPATSDVCQSGNHPRPIDDPCSRPNRGGFGTRACGRTRSDRDLQQVIQ